MKPVVDPLAGVPLHSIEIEQGLLGALMLHNVDFDVVAGKLQPEHFFEPLHQVIFAEIARKIGLGEPATPLTIRGALPAEMDIAGLTPNQYLARLASNSVVTHNVPAFADNIVQLSIARTHVLNARDLVDGCLGGVPIDEALRAFHDTSEATRNGYLGPGLRDTSSTIMDTMKTTIERLGAAIRNEPTALGMPTKILELDRIIGGLARGTLVVMAGRPGMGKSSVMVSLARQMAVAGYGMGIQSLEMDKNSIGVRMLTDHIYDPAHVIQYNALIRGGVTEEEGHRLASESYGLHDLPIEFDFATSMTVAEVAGSARRMASKLELRGKTLDVLWIDYLKFIKATSRYMGQKHYEIGEITAALKGLSRILNCCIVLFHQLNREVEKTGDRRPGMEHLRESGDVEQDADLIVLLFREAYYIDRSGDLAKEEKKAEAALKLADLQFDLDMIVAKQRMGPAADAKVFCDVRTSSVRSREMVHQALAPALPPEERKAAPIPTRAPPLDFQ